MFDLIVIFSVFVDAASVEKERLEEKQRASRRERSKDEEDWSNRCVFEVLITRLSSANKGVSLTP